MRKALRDVLFGLCTTIAALAQQPSAATLARTVDQAIAEGRLEQARSALAELLAQPQIGLEVLLECGARLAEAEQFDPARAVFARAVKDYPRNFEARYNLALADIGLRQLDEARAAIEPARDLSKDQQLAREYLLGKIHEAAGEASLAEHSYAVAFSGAPQQENYALDLGLFYLRRRNYAKARETLASGIRYHPESVFLLLGMGLAEYLDNDAPGAARTCDRMLSIEPGFGPAQLLLAVAHYASGENEKCRKETAGVINRPGAPPFLYYLHAASMLRLGSKDFQAILADLDRATHAIPDCSYCYLALSKVHQQMGNNRAAIKELETLVTRVDPQFANGWYRLAGLYQQAGRAADAASALDKFQRIKTATTASESEYLGKFLVPEIAGSTKAQ